MSSSLCDFYLCENDLDKQNISYHQQEIKSMVVNMLYNLNYRYYSNDSKIKCVSSTILYIGFDLIQYVINLDVVSFSMVFNDFDFMFLSMYCWFESINLFFSSKILFFLFNIYSLYYKLVVICSRVDSNLFLLDASPDPLTIELGLVWKDK